MQCVKASMPVPAVSTGGRPRVSSGSQIATLGSRCGLRTIVLRPVWGSWIRVPRPASLPVPAVVGMAAIGGRSAVIRVEPAGRQVVVGQAARVRGQQPDGLRRVDRAAAAQADQAVAPPVAVGVEARQDVGLGRVGLDAVEDDRAVRAPATTSSTRPEATQPRVGDDQRPRDAQPGQLLGQVARAHLRRRGCGWER